jgi:hypothetical protein
VVEEEPDEPELLVEPDPLEGAELPELPELPDDEPEPFEESADEPADEDSPDEPVDAADDSELVLRLSLR